jgi:hypothetical protein
MESNNNRTWCDCICRENMIDDIFIGRGPVRNKIVTDNKITEQVNSF